MKRRFIRFVMGTLGLFSLLIVVVSCVKDDDISIADPQHYMDSDVQSYGDLFKVFWSTMDERYNYFYEQKRRDGLDWKAIYREYYPKFLALKSYKREGFSDGEIKGEANLAAGYFREIIDPIIDRHFSVSIYLPYSREGGVVNRYNFRGGMSIPQNNVYPFNLKYGYMHDRLGSDKITGSYDYVDNGNRGNFTYLSGRLKSNPDIYYFTYNEFSLSRFLKLDLLDRYLSPDSDNNLLLTISDIDNNAELNSIKDLNFRWQVREFTVDILNRWNSFSASSDMMSFNNQLNSFKSTEILTDSFIQTTQRVLTRSKQLVDYRNSDTYSPVLTSESLTYIRWFIGRMSNHVEYGYKFGDFQEAGEQILERTPFYKKFLNPLHRGEIKKLILDLRDNGGGAVVDARFFTERLVTRNALWCYQRTKEGSGRFSYTPWVSAEARPHVFGAPGNIPIAVLTDRGSASMSELSTLMLKSQGNQIVSIGDYSAGATAGLSGNNDDFNGGLIGDVAGVMSFYMPMMATKNAGGEVIEGIGVKPDIFVTPVTNAELSEMQSSPGNFVDRVVLEAIKYLSSK